MQCAEKISADGIDILVNLNGHTAGNRNGVCALRPAPVQLVYLAYPGPMGADYIDYTVTDRVVCPPANRAFYKEKILMMPHCYQVNSYRDLYSEVLDPSKLPSRKDMVCQKINSFFATFAAWDASRRICSRSG
jgi:predicted O-linked N-acetylglucosamine transferase (SPINDLY family)